MWNSREREGEGEKIVKPRIWVECDLNFFLLPSMCATFLGGALPRIEIGERTKSYLGWRIPDGPVSLRSLSLDFLLLPFLLSSPSSLYALVSATRSDDALKLKTLEMGHSRHLFLSPPFSLSFSFSLPLSFLARFSVGCLSEKDRGPKERASPSDVGCHSSYSFGSHVRGGGPWPVGRTNAE